MRPRIKELKLNSHYNNNNEEEEEVVEFREEEEEEKRRRRRRNGYRLISSRGNSYTYYKNYCKVIKKYIMAGQSRKWMILVATIWIQAFTGTNFDFSAYSSELKSVLRISQIQLNYLAVASDLGKVFGWSSGLALMYFPLWFVLFMAAFMGFVGYGIQWLVLTNVITLPYILVFLCCLSSGLSICWFNTVCFVLCIQNFPGNRPLALSLTVSFNGVSAALYTLAYNAINPSSTVLYLLLNALIPLMVSLIALVPILRQPSLDPLPPDGIKKDSLMFLFLNIIAILTGVYLLLFSSNTSGQTTARLLLGGAVFLLVFPLCVPGLLYARSWFHHNIHTSFQLHNSGFLLIDVDELEIRKGLLSNGARNENGDSYQSTDSIGLITDQKGSVTKEKESSVSKLIVQDELIMLGEEHSLGSLVRRLDFWLYYFSYFCGGTIGLVYSNNLGQIAQSMGQSTSTATLITLYSSFSFFGRLLSAAPDYMRAKVYFARTGWLAIALFPTPIAFFLLAGSGHGSALYAGTALVGLSSGFIFAAAVSITAELFGPNSVGVNHNILITNIPIGSLIYGFLAALVYDSNATSGLSRNAIRMVSSDSSVVCMGRQCYFLTFVGWGCLSVIGLVCSVLLFIRTKPAYDRFERDRISTVS